MESFDMELKTYYNQVQQSLKKVKNEVQADNQGYIQNHPEIRDILNDFISTLLLEKPSDVFSYAQKYFSFFNKLKEQPNFQPLIIVGPSGSGKGRIVKEILKKYPNDFVLSISATTRKRREGEQDGREYFFYDQEQFQNEIDKGSFIEYFQVHGNHYGTFKSQISNNTKKGHIVIIEIDIQGAQKIHKHYQGANFLFINAPSQEELYNRLRNRNTESEQQIQMRVKNSLKEIEDIKNAGYFNEIINDNFEETIAQVIKFLQEKYPQKNLD